MKLQTRLSLVVLALFLCGWLIAGVTVYAMEQKSAQEETIHTAEVLLSMAISAGRYTFEEISPLLIRRVQENFLFRLHLLMVLINFLIV